MLSIESPIPQFFNLDGTPLNAGKLYFGTAGANPEVSPIPVYWDAAGTIPASQPIATSNGYPVNGSTLATVYIASDYSLTVRTSAGVLVMYAPTSADFSNATAVAAAVAALSADLADSVTAGKGASLVAVRDVGAFYAGSTVEAALQELGATLTPTASAVATLAALMAGRTAPHANFNWFTADFTVTGCQGPGRAYVLQDLRDVWLTKYTSFMTGGVTWVSPAGNDGTGIGTYTAPYLTVDKAIRTSPSGEVRLMPGTYETTGFRYTDTQGDRPKMLVAPFGGVTLRTAGDTISAATWTANGTYPNVWETTLVSTNHVTRVLHSGHIDPTGRSTPMPKYSSIATVDGSGFGWWYDSATKKLYVRKGVENVNSTTKSSLTAVYATGGDNSLLVYSTKLYLENITLDYYISVLKVSGQATPECWMKNCTVRYAEGNSRLVSGGGMYSQGCTYYRSAADHANYNTALGVTAYGVEINDTTFYAGDTDSFPVVAGAQATNPISSGQIKNSSSNHDGYVVRVGGAHNEAFGPLIADTDGSYSWNLGVSAGYSSAVDAASKYAFLTQGASARAWYDGCSAGPGNGGLNSDSSAVVNYFNTFGARVTSSSGTFSAYVPA